ncbi:MAG: signal peptidase I [Bacillota bacterium]|nr:signal peptidase I [Bacillota bacterium]
MNDFEEMGAEKKPYKNSIVKELLKDICIALIIVLAISFVIKPTIVKETSMEDTLYENNYLIVNKLAYLNREHPQRGDIIVFKSDLINPDTGKEMLLIKRVIGIEGDVLSFKDNEVYRNGKLLREDYIMDEMPEVRDYPNGQTFEIGNDEVFTMGDHRSVSRDSRDAGVGMVKEEEIVGKAFIRLFPFSEIRLL